LRRFAGPRKGSPAPVSSLPHPPFAASCPISFVNGSTRTASKIPSIYRRRRSAISGVWRARVHVRVRSRSRLRAECRWGRRRHVSRSEAR
jgi:hypothetical protein